MITTQPDRIRLWVDALRSGEYTQARGAFTGFIEIDLPTEEPRTVIGHCCLAVATDVAIKNGCEDVRWHTDPVDGSIIPQQRYNPDTMDDPSNYDHTVDDDGTVWINYESGDLPDEVVEWFGLKRERDENGAWRIPNDPRLDGRAAITRNDSDMDDYDAIADAIEQDLEKGDPS